MLRRVLHALKERAGGESADEPQGHRVLILGAGASRAQWEWEFADKKKGETLPPPPPLNVDFFDIARQVNAEATEQMYDVIRDLCSGETTANLPLHSLTMEDAFHFVFENALQHPDDTNARLLYAHFMILIYSVIAATTNPLCRNSSGPIDELLYYSFAAPHIGRITVITFNYDLLVEKSLSCLQKASRSEFQFPQIYRVPFVNYNFLFRMSYEDPEYIRVLKPHGSLNWLISSRYAVYPGELSSLGPVDLHLASNLEIPLGDDNLVYAVGYAGGSFGEYTAFIIPPTRAKEQIKLTWLEIQEASVKEALRLATEIVVLGYSFPQADPMAGQMIRVMADEAHTLQKMVVFDRSGRVAELLRQRIRRCPVRHATDVHMGIWSGILSPFSGSSDD